MKEVLEKMMEKQAIGLTRFFDVYIKEGIFQSDVNLVDF